MLHLVTGGCGSGKSAYAEQITCSNSLKAGGGRLYIATMLPYGEETKRKITRHREMRADKGFETVECYIGLEKIAGQKIVDRQKNMSDQNTTDSFQRDWIDSSCVLLECMSNLVANEIYEPQGAGGETVEAIIRGVQLLESKCHALTIVTNEVCSECSNDSAQMQAYKKVLSEINRRLAQMADAVTEVVYGIPIKLKGAEPKYRDMSEKEVTRMKLVIGGAYQGKLSYAKKEYGFEQSDRKGKSTEHFVWVDGADCTLEDIYKCGGVYHFEAFLKRMMKAGKSVEGLAEVIAEKNPDIVIVSTEIGYGLVPIDSFEREYREQVGRICTNLAKHSMRVDRVVCGIGTMLKGEQDR